MGCGNSKLETVIVPKKVGNDREYVNGENKSGKDGDECRKIDKDAEKVCEHIGFAKVIEFIFK